MPLSRRLTPHVGQNGDQNFKRYSGKPRAHIGQFDDTGYHYFGLFCLIFELGIDKNSAGHRTEYILVHDYQSDFDAIPAIDAYQQQHLNSRHAFRDWQLLDHPQFGHVEIDDIDCVDRASPSLPHPAVRPQ